MENNTYDDDDDDFRSDNHADQLNTLDDLFNFGSQENDSYEDPCAYSCKKPPFNLVRAFVQVIDYNPRAYNIL